MSVSPEAQASMDALKALRGERMSHNAVAEDPAPKVTKKLTFYDVYETGDFGKTLILLASGVEAANDIKAIASQSPVVGNTGYLAIPQRSLKVRTVSSVSVPKVSIA